MEYWRFKVKAMNTEKVEYAPLPSDSLASQTCVHDLTCDESFSLESFT